MFRAKLNRSEFYDIKIFEFFYILDVIKDSVEGTGRSWCAVVGSKVNKHSVDSFNAISRLLWNNMHNNREK